MAIEKMIMVDLVGHLEDLDRVSKEIILSKSLQQVNAYQEIDNTNFKISATEENKDALLDVCSIKPYVDANDFSEVNNEIKKLKEMCSVKDSSNVLRDELIMEYEVLKERTYGMSKKFTTVFDNLKEFQTQKSVMSKYMDNLSRLTKLDVQMQELAGLTTFLFQMYKISKENSLRLEENYDNVPSVVIKVNEDREFDTIIAFTPNMLKNESDRFFKSLNCESVELPKEYTGTPQQVYKLLSEKIEEAEKKIKEFTKELKEISKENVHEIHVIERSMELSTKATEVKNNTARTKEFFYLCGWVPQSFLNKFKEDMNCFGDRLIITERNYNEVNNPNVVPPTKLKNNSLVRPFESLVAMYGIPAYNEVDPTTFLSITYVIIFGMMFGDLGQGLVFFFAGLFLKFKKSRPNLGGVLARLGISSSIFGCVYGSFFGFEDVIPALVVRPMENIMEVLLFAVAFGCCLLIIGFVYSLINNMKKKDVENGWFGPNGVTGFVLYISLLTFALTKVKNISILPTAVWIMIFIILLGILLMRQPLANLVMKKRPLYNEGKGDYFIEGSFGLAEVLLSMFSNTVSFIRVGAFALNHVGLFMAFEALAKMMHTSAGSAVMYLIGNIIIIGLEGLIVFIQALRLEYYELFSKYYDGSGTAFEPVKLSDDFRLDIERKVIKNMDKKLVLEK